MARQSNDQIAFATSADGITWSTAPVVISGAKTSTGVSVVADGNVIHMAYRGTGDNDDHIFYCAYQRGEWGQPQDLGSLYDCKTSKSPAIAVYDGKLFLLFRGKGSDTLYYSTRPLADASAAWTKPPTSLTSANGAETSDAPAMAVHDGKLFAIYHGKDSARIYSCYYANGLWSGQTPVTEDTRRGPSGPQTSTRVGLAEFATRLYMAYKGKDSGNLWSSSLGAEEWFEQTDITAQNSALSQSGPALAVHNGVLVMAFRGNDSDTLHGCCLHDSSRG